MSGCTLPISTQSFLFYIYLLGLRCAHVPQHWCGGQRTTCSRESVLPFDHRQAPLPAAPCPSASTYFDPEKSASWRGDVTCPRSHSRPSRFWPPPPGSAGRGMGPPGHGPSARREPGAGRKQAAHPPLPPLTAGETEVCRSQSAQPLRPGFCLPSSPAEKHL